MIYELKAHSASIVLVGAFNPAIISPAWLALNNIISADDLAAADLSYVHKEISQFTVSGIGYEVVPERFQAITQEEPFVQVLDSVLLIFGELLPHTPITQFGINYEVKFSLDTSDSRVAFGRELAPLKPWGRFGEDLSSRGDGNIGGITQINMTDVKPPNRESGWRTVIIRPDSGSSTGVIVSINDHYNVSAETTEGARRAVRMLEKNFDTSISDAKRIVGDLQEFARR